MNNNQQVPNSEHVKLIYTSQFHTALNAQKTAYRALEMHRRNNPVRWQFWKQPPAEWKRTKARLTTEFIQSGIAFRETKSSQTEGGQEARQAALRLGGMLSLLLFVGLLGLAVNEVAYDGQTNWLENLSIGLAAFGAVGGIMCASIFAG